MSSRGKKKKKQRLERVVQLLGELSQEHLLRETRLQERIAGRTILYLDTKDWIHLRHVELDAKAMEPEYKQIAVLLNQLTDAAKVICPISSSLFDELMLQSDPNTLVATARLMDRLSDKVSMRLPIQQMGREFHHLLWSLSDRLRPEPSIRPWTAAGFKARPEPSPNEIGIWENSTPEEVRASFETSWKIGFEADYQIGGHLDYTEQMFSSFVDSMNDESSRTAARGVKFEELVQREKRQYVSTTLREAGELLPYSDEAVQAAVERLNLDGNPKSAPSTNLMAMIVAARLQSNRPVVKNDVQDFLHAVSAVPYCDVFRCDRKTCGFLTEKPLNLDSIYETQITWKATDLLSYLSELAN